MRILDITVYSQYFRFVVEGDKAEDDASYGRPSFSVIYDNERINVTCDCKEGINCKHAAYVHEFFEKRGDRTLKGIFLDARTPSAQTINDTTISRIRGAFAREYNLFNGIVQDSRTQQAPTLGWEGNVGENRMRVIQRTPASFMVYEKQNKNQLSDRWALVVGIRNPACQDPACSGSSMKSTEGCIHAEAVREAVKEWRRIGYMETPEPMTNNPIYSYVTDARPIQDAINATIRSQSDQIRAQLRNAMLGIDLGREDESRISYYTNASLNAEVAFNVPDNATLTTSAAPGTEGKLSPDIDKAIKALNEPKSKKPPKPRTRFTEIDL